MMLLLVRILKKIQTHQFQDLLSNWDFHTVQSGVKYNNQILFGPNCDYMNKDDILI